MIPKDFITHWRQFAPWINDEQVEQDLILSRALVELFQNPFIFDSLAFRGGTALNKVFFSTPARYSEDIDLVQIKSGPIKPIADKIHDLLNPWLGQPKVKQGSGPFTFIYRVESNNNLPIRLKVEINTREHFSVLDLQKKAFELSSPWFTGKTHLKTYALDELMGTKLRALYQRKKGRDLFDLWWVKKNLDLDLHQTVHCFNMYMQKNKLQVSWGRV